MYLKTNLHLHSKEDNFDVLNYSIFEAIDKAAELGFEVLAWTPHRQVLCCPEHIEYAKKKNIILFSGIELCLKGCDVLIINCGKDAEKIETFAQLDEYKKANKQALIIAPHPFFPVGEALKNKLIDNINLFDIIEKSWFYTKGIDFNLKAGKIAGQFKKPFVSTSDTHHLKYLNVSYALVEAEKNQEAILKSLHEGKFENFSQPISLWTAIIFILWLDFRPKTIIVKLKRRIKKLLGY